MGCNVTTESANEHLAPLSKNLHSIAVAHRSYDYESLFARLDLAFRVNESPMASMTPYAEIIFDVCGILNRNATFAVTACHNMR